MANKYSTSGKNIYQHERFHQEIHIRYFNPITVAQSRNLQQVKPPLDGLESPQRSFYKYK